MRLQASREAVLTTVPDAFTAEASVGSSSQPTLALSFLEVKFGRLAGLAQFWGGILGDEPLATSTEAADFLSLLESPIAQLRRYLPTGEGVGVELILCDGSALGPPARRRDLEVAIAQTWKLELRAWAQGGGTQAVGKALRLARDRFATGATCVLVAAAELDRGAVVGLLRLPVAVAYRCPVFAALEGATASDRAPVRFGSERRADPLVADDPSERRPEATWHWRPEDSFFVTQTFTSLVALVVGALAIRECVIPPCGLGRTGSRASQPTPFLADQRGQGRSVDVALFGATETGLLRLRTAFEAQAALPPCSTAWPSEPFLFAASSKQELLAQLTRAIRQLSDWKSPLSLTRLARALRSDRGSCRVAFLARDRQECLGRLRQAVDKVGAPSSRQHIARFGFHCVLPQSAGEAVAPAQRVAFMAPGIGSAYPGLLQGQAVRFPAVRDGLDRFAMQAHPQAAALGERLYANPDDHHAVWSDLDWTGAVGSIAVMALEPVANKLGLVPDIRIGFSNGELAALLVAGGLKAGKGRALEAMIWDAVSSGQQRARRGDLKTGRMVAVHLVSAGRDLLQGLLQANPTSVFLAIDAAVSHVVLFGLLPQIDHVMERLSEAGNICLPLPFDRPFHTHLITTELAAVETLLSGLNLGCCEQPVWSCARNQPYPEDSDEMTSIIKESITHTVRFREALETLHDQGFSTFVEIGGNAQLSGYARDTLKGRKAKIVALDRHGTDGALQVLDAASYLFSHGFRVDTDSLAPHRAERIDPVPNADAVESVPSTESCPMPPVEQYSDAMRAERLTRPGSALSEEQEDTLVAESLALTRSFMESQQRVLLALVARRRKTRGLTGHASQQASRLFSEIRQTENDREIECSLTLDHSRDEHLDHHRLGRVSAQDAWRPEKPLAVLAMVMTLEFMVQAADRYLASTGRRLSFRGADNLAGSRWVMAKLPTKTVNFVVSDQTRCGDETLLRVRLLDQAEDDPTQETEAASSWLLFGDPEPLTAFELRGEVLSTPWTALDFQRFALFHGRVYHCFDQLREFRTDGVELSGRVPDQSRLVEGARVVPWLTPATLLDCVPQAVAFWLTARGLSWFTAFPVSVFRYRQAAPLPCAGVAIVCRARLRVQGDTIVADACLVDDSGHVFAQIERIQIVVYRMYQPLLGRLYWREGGALLTQAEQVAEHRLEVRRSCPRQLESDIQIGGGIFGAALAQLVLTSREQEAFSEVTLMGAQGRSRLLAYLVAKESIIAWYQTHAGQAIDHLDFSILVELKDNGRVHMSWLTYPFGTDVSVRAVPTITLDYAEHGWCACALSIG